MSSRVADDDIIITPVGILDAWRVGQILCRGLSEMGERPVSALERWFNCLMLPLALPFVRHGYRAARGGKILGCAYVDWRRKSGYVFNVAVDAQYRRQGVATALMRFLEQEARGQGMRWLGLYVDRDNVAAQRLYQEEGYQPHATQILRRTAPTRLPDAVEPVAVRPLSYRQGHGLMQRYREREFLGSGEWAGEVVLWDFPPELPAGGRYWQITHSGAEIGVACCRREPEERAAIHLWLAPDEWGEQNVILGVIHALTRRRKVDVDVTSEAHLQVLRRTLVPLGFATVRRSQLLMLKEVG